MKYYSNICSICGTDTYKLRFVKEGVPNKVNHLRSKILLMWKRECTKSLCDILFDSKCPDLFLEYFQQGMYCPDCLQIIRDLDFTWKQFLECKRRIEKQSTKVRTLLTRNYQNGDHKSEAAVIEARISGLPDSFVDDYSAKDVLEMIYSVIHSKQGIKKAINQTMKTEGGTTFPTDLNNVKEEPTYECNDSFDSGDDDWHSENATSDETNTNNASLKRVESEIKYSNEIKRRRRSTLTSYAISEEEESETELESDEDQFDQSNDKEWKPPSSYSPYKLTDKEQEFLKQKRMQGLHKLANNKAEPDNWGNSEDKDANFDKSTVKKAKRFKKKEFKNYLSKKKKRNSKEDHGLQTDIILDDSELVILKKLSTMRIDYKPLRSLSDLEVNLALKISQYSKLSIQRLKLSKEEEKSILKLREKVLVRERRYKYRPLKRIDFCCTEENCNEKLRSEEELEGHIRKKHKGETMPFYCTTCPKKFSRINKVRSHRQITHKGVKMLYYYFCKICQKGYKTEEELNSHSDSAHQGPNPFSCAFCDTEHETSALLVRHMNESHPDVTPEMSEELQKLTCDKCGKCFTTESKLTKHKTTHEMKANKNLFNCDQCKKSFPSESSLKNHIDTQHTNIVCDICGKSVVKYCFNKHINRHNGVLKYECHICNRRFKSHQQMTDHERMHSGIRSFICSVCGKGFYTKNILDGHEKIHEPGYVPRKPFRRPKSNRKKEVQEPNPVPESRKDEPLTFKHHSEAYLDHRDLLNNSTIVQPSPFINCNSVDHTTGFMYHTM